MRRALIIGIWVTVTALFVIVLMPPLKAHRAFLKHRQALAKGDAYRALDYLEQAVQAWPHAGEYHVALVDGCRALLGQLPDGPQRQALQARLDRENERFLIVNPRDMGLLYAKMQKDLDAWLSGGNISVQRITEQIDRLLKLDPHNPELLYRLAKIERVLGQPQKSEDLLRQVINIKPLYRDAYVLLADAYAQRPEDFEKLKQTYNAVFRTKALLVPLEPYVFPEGVCSEQLELLWSILEHKLLFNPLLRDQIARLGPIERRDSQMLQLFLSEFYDQPQLYADNRLFFDRLIEGSLPDEKMRLQRDIKVLGLDGKSTVRRLQSDEERWLLRLLNIRLMRHINPCFLPGFDQQLRDFYVLDLKQQQQRADRALEKHDHRAALEAYLAMADQDPDNAPQLYNAAVCLVNLRRYREARELLNQVLQKSPGYDMAQQLKNQLDHVLGVR